MTDTSLLLTSEDLEKEHRMFLRRLAADTKKAASLLKPTEARYLVDLYYQIQDFRKAAANQARSHKQFGEPNYLVGFVGDQMQAMENLIRRSMGHYAASDPTGLWSQSIVGVGPVTSAALLAHIDIRKANTVGKIWRFCFPPGTLINTPDGMRKIEDLDAGDEVLNHLGRPTSVIRRFQRVTDDGLVSIKARGVLPVSATHEHPFWVRKTKTSDPEWVEAGSIKPDMWVGLPISQVQTDTSFRLNPSNRAKGKQPLLGEPFDIDVEMAWFLGRFVADGSTCVYSDGEYQRGNSCITFAYTDSADETSRCENVAQRFGSFRWSDTGTSKQLYFGALTVANGLSELVGHGAENKKIPYQILYHQDIEVVKSFVLGYFSGDGHVVKDGRTAGWGISSTVSLELATGLQHLLLRLGIFSTCHTSNRSSVIGEIRGRQFNQKPYRYVLSVRPNDMAVIMGKDRPEDSCWTNRRPVMENGFFWTPVTEVREEDYVGEVFNIETEDHTYTAMNLAVHNCGLDPTVTWGKGQKRPWNAKLKVVCVRPDQRVTTRRGYVPIDQIKVGDEVLTHLGRFRKVTQVMVNDHVGDIYGLSLYGQGNRTAWVTGNHPVYAHKLWSVPRGGESTSYRVQAFDGSLDPDWVPAEEINAGSLGCIPRITEITETPEIDLGSVSGAIVDGDTVRAQGYSGFAHPNSHVMPRKIQVDRQIARLIGLFLAEGHVTRNQIGFSFHVKETEYHDFVIRTLEDRFNLPSRVVVNEENNAIQISVTSKLLATFLKETFGGGSIEKTIPMSWITGLGHAELTSLLRGVFEGDGHITDDGIRLHIMSEGLARATVDSLLRIGVVAGMSSRSPNGPFQVFVRDLHSMRRMCWGEIVAKTSMVSVKSFEENALWQPFSPSSLLGYAGTVYNLEVEEDHSYVVEGLAVHNCWHIGECFKKFSKREDCLYGRLYRVRKQFEINRNESGANRETARITLETKKIGKDTPTYAAYAEGKLPPGRLDLRATRFATKIFLSHWHEVAYRYHHGEKPARPYAIAILGHADYIPVPNYPWDDDAKQQEVFEFWDRMFKAVPVAAADETEESEDEDAE